jgi:type VI secretion system protein ImpJ
MWASKPLWLEAMFVRPQHFQQAERHAAWAIDARIAAVASHGWGWAALAIDQNQLRLGKIGLASGRGVMPDGTVFDLADAGVLPSPRDVPPDLAERHVYLALPALRRGGAEVQYEERQAARYRPTEIEVQDVVSQYGQMAQVRIGQLAFRLMFEGEDQDGYVTLGCARIDRVREDRMVLLSERFIPPMLDAGADSTLANFVAETVALLQSRGNALAERLNPDNWYGTAGLLDFALLQTINRHEPSLSQFSRMPGLRPVELHRALLHLAGDLATFKTGQHRPNDYPIYQHVDLEASFAPLMADIRKALTTVTEQPVVPIPIEARRFGIFVAQPADRTLLVDSQFVLAVNASVPPDSIRTLFPSQVKIGPVEEIRDLVNLQLPGIGLVPLAVAPRQLPFRRGYTYFELDRAGPSWSKLGSSAAIALHVSGEFPDLEMDFWAIRP